MIGMSKMYGIYKIIPAPEGDNYRLLELFETKESAELVLEALEKVNIDFNIYKIIKRK